MNYAQLAREICQELGLLEDTAPRLEQILINRIPPAFAHDSLIMRMVSDERAKQLAKGYTPEHDHGMWCENDLSYSAFGLLERAYLAVGDKFNRPSSSFWRLGADAYKPAGTQQQLVQAAALVIAEAELYQFRIDKKGEGKGRR